MESIVPDPTDSNTTTCEHCGEVEVWRSVLGFEDLYEISSLGRARSLPRLRATGFGVREVPGRLLVCDRVAMSDGPHVTYASRRHLFMDTFGRAPFGAKVSLSDGNADHLCSSNLSWSFPHLGYRNMHHKVVRLRGKASQHACVDCGRQADDWAYTNSGYAEVLDERPEPLRAVPYSLDPAEYDPRCRTCHRQFDWQARPGRPGRQGVAA